MVYRLRELAVIIWQRCSSACLLVAVEDAGLYPTGSLDVQANTSQQHCAAMDEMRTSTSTVSQCPCDFEKPTLLIVRRLKTIVVKYPRSFQLGAGNVVYVGLQNRRKQTEETRKGSASIKGGDGSFGPLQCVAELASAVGYQIPRLSKCYCL